MPVFVRVWRDHGLLAPLYCLLIWCVLDTSFTRRPYACIRLSPHMLFRICCLLQLPPRFRPAALHRPLTPTPSLCPHVPPPPRYAARDRDVLCVLLKAWPMRFVGNISYGMYLYQTIVYNYLITRCDPSRFSIQCCRYAGRVPHSLPASDAAAEPQVTPRTSTSTHRQVPAMAFLPSTQPPPSLT